MAFRLIGAKPLPAPMLEKLLGRSLGTNFSEILIKLIHLHSRKSIENVVCETVTILSRTR